MRKSVYVIAAMLLTGGLMTNGNIVRANDSCDSYTVNITQAIDQYIEASSTNNNSGDVLGNAEEVSEGNDVNNNTSVGVEIIEATTIKYPEFVGVVLPRAEEYVNIRQEDNEESEVVGKLYIGSGATILEEGEEWTKVQSGNVTGYIKNEFTMTGDEAGEYAEANLSKVITIDTETLYVRSEKTTDSTCVAMVPGGNIYEVKEETEDWVKIGVDDDTEGYVSCDYVNMEFLLDDAISREEEEAKIKAEQDALDAAKKKENNAENSSSDKSSQNADNNSNSSNGSATSNVTVSDNGSAGRSDIANYALQFVGNPYVWGGTSLTNGADCSGFVLSVYANFGYSLPHSSSAQSSCGSEVSLDSLQPGDLLFYRGSNGNISHVTMYIGDGQVVHASSSTTGIIVSSVNYRTPCCARRIAN